MQDALEAYYNDDCTDYQVLVVQAVLNAAQVLEIIPVQREQSVSKLNVKQLQELRSKIDTRLLSIASGEHS